MIPLRCGGLRIDAGAGICWRFRSLSLPSGVPALAGLCAILIFYASMHNLAKEVGGGSLMISSQVGDKLACGKEMWVRVQVSCSI